MHDAFFRVLAAFIAVLIAVGVVVGAPPAVLGGLAYFGQVCLAF